MREKAEVEKEVKGNKKGNDPSSSGAVSRYKLSRGEKSASEQKKKKITTQKRLKAYETAKDKKNCPMELKAHEGGTLERQGAEAKGKGKKQKQEVRVDPAMYPKLG